ncbi:hypothetical protein [Thiomicrospira sp.]|uniref:hypothetical protein n=1 Tax=Thiomicrospira sp. TaxID=935 RepID=UPI002F924E1C
MRRLLFYIQVARAFASRFGWLWVFENIDIVKIEAGVFINDWEHDLSDLSFDTANSFVGDALSYWND